MWVTLLSGVSNTFGKALGSWKLFALLAVALVLSLWGMKYLYDANADLRRDYQTAQSTVKAHSQTIESMKKQMITMRDLESELNDEINHANIQIDYLNDELDTGTKRLQFNHSCGVSDQSATKPVSDATTTRNEAKLRSDYIHHRRAIEQARLQIIGLQNYIKALPPQCVVGNKAISIQKLNKPNTGKQETQ